MCMIFCLCVHLGNTGMVVRRECWFPRNWSYRWFWAATLVLGAKPVSSTRAISALSHWDISLSPRAGMLCVSVSSEQKGEWKDRPNPVAGCSSCLPGGEWLPGSLSSLFEHLHSHIHSRAASDSIQDFDHQRTPGFPSALGIGKTREMSVKLIGVKGLFFLVLESGTKPKVHADPIMIT